MAKQKGLIKIEGTIGDMTFLKTGDGYIVKEKTSFNGARIASDPAFKRTRENNQEFGRATKAGKTLRNAIHSLLLQAKDPKTVSRLVKEMMKVLKADTSSKRGERNVVDGEAELLKGFEFNIKATLTTTLYAAYHAAIDRVNGALTINIPSFIPEEKIIAPDGSTHFKIVTVGTEVDFENETFVTDSKDSGILAIGTEATAVINLVNSVTANSGHPLFLALGIQFFQYVNNVYYPLQNGNFNPLGMVKVSGA